MNFGRVGFVMEGDWSAAVTYDTLSIVLYEGAVYAAKKMSAGSEPSTHPADWMLWVGSPIVSAEQTAGGYDLTITNGDGTTSVVHLLNGQVTEAELTTALSGLRDAFNANTAEEYDSTATYSEGDYCLYNDVLYRCKTDILSPEAWDSTHWEAASLADDVRDLSEDLYSNKVDAITSTASGEIVTIEDGADGLPIKDMTVSLLPVQDLHGQSAPYPSGGGKNKWHLVANGYYNSSGNLVTSLPLGCSDKISVTEGQQITFGGTNRGTKTLTLRGYFFDANNAIIGSQLLGENVDTWTVPSGAKTVALWFLESDYTDTMTQTECDSLGIMMVVGSSLGTFAPYSNVCPISGWTGVDVYQKGFNLWDEEWEVGNIDTSTGENTSATDRIRSKNYIPCIAGATYFFKVPSFTGAYFNRVFFYDANGGYISYVQEYISTAGFTFTVPSNCAYMKFRLSAQYGTTYNNDICINLSGSRNGEYESYKGKPTIPIDWQSSAGTVYDGSLDLTTGVLTVTHKIADMGDINWSIDSNRPGVFYGYVSGRMSGSNVIACSAYQVRNIDVSTSYDCYISGHISYGGNTVFFRDSSMAGFTKEQVKTAVTGYKFVYKLATSIEYTLSENHIATLLGTNNFWSNGNGVVDLEYRCDTKLYIEQLTKPSEDDMTANANIASGKFFMVGNRLMLSTTAIAQGEQIVVGTNCSEVSLADALNQINA